MWLRVWSGWASTTSCLPWSPCHLESRCAVLHCVKSVLAVTLDVFRCDVSSFVYQLQAMSLGGECLHLDLTDLIVHMPVTDGMPLHM